MGIFLQGLFEQAVSHSSPSMDYLAPPGLFRLASAGDVQRKSIEPGSRGEIESFAICFTPREVVRMLRPKDGAEVLAFGERTHNHQVQKHRGSPAGPSIPASCRAVL